MTKQQPEQRELPPYIQALIARAPRPTDEQARGLVVLFEHARARRIARETQAAS